MERGRKLHRWIFREGERIPCRTGMVYIRDFGILSALAFTKWS
jgi:hypothetical protein